MSRQARGQNLKQVKREKTTPPRLARRWGVGEAKVISFIESGELIAINAATARASRPRYLIDEADIEAFELARRVVSSSVDSPRPRLPVSSSVRKLVQQRASR